MSLGYSIDFVARVVTRGETDFYEVMPCPSAPGCVEVRYFDGLEYLDCNPRCSAEMALKLAEAITLVAEKMLQTID